VLVERDPARDSLSISYINEENDAYIKQRADVTCTTVQIIRRKRQT